MQGMDQTSTPQTKKCSFPFCESIQCGLHPSTLRSSMAALSAVEMQPLAYFSIPEPAAPCSRPGLRHIQDSSKHVPLPAHTPPF